MWGIIIVWCLIRLRQRDASLCLLSSHCQLEVPCNLSENISTIAAPPSLLQTFPHLLLGCEQLLWFCGRTPATEQMLPDKLMPGYFILFSPGFNKGERRAYKMSDCCVVETSTVSRCHNICTHPLTLIGGSMRKVESAREREENRGNKRSHQQCRHSAIYWMIHKVQVSV